MTDYCKIGPISILNPHLVEGSSYKTTEEEFEVYCTHWQYKQLLSLIDEGFNSQGSRGATIFNGDNPWSPVYIDSSLLISDNDYLKHKGWYIVTNVEISDIYVNKYLKAKISVTKVSSLQNEYLTMDYTTGAYDGTQKDSTYDNTVTATIFSDTFDSFDTTSTWTSIEYTKLSSATITANGILNLTGTASTYNKWGTLFTQTQRTFSGAFTVTTDLSWVSRPSSGHPKHSMGFFISPTNFTGSTIQGWKDVLLVQMVISSSSTTYAVKSCDTKGAWTTLVKDTIDNTTTENWKFIFDGTGRVAISLNTGSGYVQKYYGITRLSTTVGLRMGYAFQNSDNVSRTAKSGGITVTQDVRQANKNIVSLPAGAVPVLSSNFTRTGSEGVMNCYLNPSVQIPFTASDPYSGTVKAYTNNNPDSTYRQMFSLDEIPTPTGFYVTNGLVKLITTTTGVTFQYWNGTSWATLNTFNMGTLNLLKLIDIGPQSVTFQANTTKWTLKAGKPYVIVKHPNDVLTYRLKDTYAHDSTTTTSPASGADITMEDLSHAEIYNSTDTYRMQIYKLDPCTIKSDSIPASVETGIGFYDSSLDSSNYNSKDKLPFEYPLQTDQHISIKQV